MKKIVTVVIVLCCFSFAGFAQQVTHSLGSGKPIVSQNMNQQQVNPQTKDVNVKTEPVTLSKGKVTGKVVEAKVPKQESTEEKKNLLSKGTELNSAKKETTPK